LGAGVGTTTFIFFVTLTACHDACKAGDEIAVRSKTSPAVPTAVPSDAISIARRRRERRIMPFERRLPARRDTSTLSADWIIKPPPRFSRVGNDAVQKDRFTPIVSPAARSETMDTQRLQQCCTAARAAEFDVRAVDVDRERRAESRLLE